MANVAVYNMEGKEVDKIELNDSIFGVEINEHLVHMAVLQQLANKRQGTQKAKTRSEVRGGGRNHGDRREQDMHVRVLQDLHSGQVVELYSLLLLEITHSSSTRKRREQLLSLHLHQELLRISSL